MSLVLRSYWRSSCSWRVRIALHWKQLSFELQSVHLVANGGEQHTAAHRAINPMRELPVLSIGDVHIGQSLAILEYLEEAHPNPPLLPADALQRAQVRQMAEVVNSGTQPLQNQRVMKYLGHAHDFPRAQQLAWSRHWIALGLTGLEALVTKHGGTYCHGDIVTFADLCLVPQLYNARRFDVDISAFPALTDVETRLSSLPAFEASHPDEQPDAP